MLLNKFVPKAKNPIKNRVWILRFSIHSNLQRPFWVRYLGIEFDTRRTLGYRVGDENRLYLWAVLPPVRSASVFCRVRNDIANRKVGALPTHFVLELAKAIHVKTLAQRIFLPLPDPIGHVPRRDGEIDRRVHLVISTLVVRRSLFEPLFLAMQFSEYIVDQPQPKYVAAL